MIKEKQKEFLKDCNDLIENKKQETFESFYNKITTYGQMGFYVGEHSVREIVEVLKQLHDTEIKKYKSFIESEDLRHKFELKEKDKESEDVKNGNFKPKSN